jgi:hypothetical protein
MTQEDQQKIIDAWNADMRESNDDEKTLRAGKRLARNAKMGCFLFWVGVAGVIVWIII